MLTMANLKPPCWREDSETRNDDRTDTVPTVRQTEGDDGLDCNSFLLIERLERARCATARETGVTESHSPRGCASRSLQSLNDCGREKKGTAWSLMMARFSNHNRRSSRDQLRPSVLSSSSTRDIQKSLGTRFNRRLLSSLSRPGSKCGAWSQVIGHVPVTYRTFPGDVALTRGWRRHRPQRLEYLQVSPEGSAEKWPVNPSLPRVINLKISSAASPEI